jgi:alkylhydroperoxidase family enzyme
MLISPEMSYHLSELGRLVRAVGLRPGSYSHADRELVDQVLCPHRGTNMVLRGHIPDALAAGVRLQAIEALRYGHDEDLTDDERELANFVREVADLRVTDESWNAMEKRLGERGVVELTIFIGLLNMILTMQHALGMKNPSDEEIDQIISDFREGKRAVPEWVDRSA